MCVCVLFFWGIGLGFFLGGCCCLFLWGGVVSLLFVLFLSFLSFLGGGGVFDFVCFVVVVLFWFWFLVEGVALGFFYY